MVRVRYAPSPTGTLHIGGARTALFNYLFARRMGGRFVLRVEDTDQARLIPGSEAAMMAGLKSLGLIWDEGPDIGGAYGPYRQSERSAGYRKYAAELLAQGKAYRCYCTPEELEQERQVRRQQGLAPRYSGKCRALTARDWEDREGQRYVLRLKVPRTGATVVEDLIRGTVTFDNSVFDDFVIAKADGSPVYNFAVVLDDYAMAISHVIRGEEHLSNTPKQILVATALGLPLPHYAHVPMILAPDRSKLSKRHGATSVEEYREQGILPQALVNYLCLLGWSPPDGQELLDLEAAGRQFDLTRVQHTAAIYDVKKLEWMNSQYLRQLPLETVIDAATPFLAALELPLAKGPALSTSVMLVRERSRTLKELADNLRFFYVAPSAFEAKAVRKIFNEPTVCDRLEVLAVEIGDCSEWNHDAVAAAFDRVAGNFGVKRAQIIHPARLALSGRSVGPGLFELVEVLGRQESVDRLRRVAASLRQGTLRLAEDPGKDDQVPYERASS